jgi:hypothetical protein
MNLFNKLFTSPQASRFLRGIAEYLYLGNDQILYHLDQHPFLPMVL